MPRLYNHHYNKFIHGTSISFSKQKRLNSKSLTKEFGYTKRLSSFGKGAGSG
jgi:hypothetical protein